MKLPQTKYNNFRTLRLEGFSTIELMIAFAILILSLTALISVTFGNQSISADTEINSEALSMARQMIEDARIDSHADFNLVNPMTTTEQLGSLTYTKSLEVEQTDAFTKKIKSLVTWSVGNRTLKTELTTLLTNPKAVSGGGTCSSVLVGDWTHPQMTSYEFGRDILGDTSSGFPVTSIESFNRKLYVTVNNTNGNNPGTFYILDTTNPSVKPILLSPSLFDNNTAVGPGLNSVAVDGDKYAYVANAYGAPYTTCSDVGGTNFSCGQLQVVDISNLASPSMKYSYKIPGVTGSGGAGIGTKVFYQDGMVYVGLASAPGPEFNIIDVGGGGAAGASPLNPILLGSYEVGNGVNDIFIKDKYAYIASPNTENLTILDISDPSHPVRVGGYSPLGGSNGKSVTVIGNTAYLGRTFGTDEFYILNVANHAGVVAVANKDIGSGNTTSINGLVVRDYLAFFVTNAAFQIWNIKNPSSIVPWAAPVTLPPGSGQMSGTAAACEGNRLFVGSLGANDKGYISIINSQ